MKGRRKTRLAWAVSGRGRALRAVLEAGDRGLLAAEVVLVVTDRFSEIEEVAQGRGIECCRLAPVGPIYHPQLPGEILASGAQWMGLTFNRLISAEAISALEGRVFNLHLSLLPLFPGFGATRRAIDAGMRMTGATVHLVDTGTDTGPILAQAACPVATGESVEDVGRRQFAVALPMLLQVVRSIADGELSHGADRRILWPRSREVKQVGSRFPAVDEDLQDFATEFCDRLQRPGVAV